MMKEKNVCKICNSKSIHSHFYNSNTKTFNKKEILKCSYCNFHFNISISQNDLNYYYQKEYNSNDFCRSELFSTPAEYFSQEKNQFKPGRSKLHINLLKKFSVRSKKLNILDCGAGLGTTLYWASKYLDKPTLNAYENDITSKNYLRYIGSNIITGDPEVSLNTYPAQFDVIIMSHFLEHLSINILNSFLDVVHDKLKPNGIVLVEVPNDNWNLYPHKKHANPPHTCFFSKKSLYNLFSKKFKVNFVNTYGYRLNKNINIFGRIYDKLYSKFYRKTFKLPYNRHGSNLLLLATSSKAL